MCFTLLNVSGINTLHEINDSEEFTFTNGLAIAGLLLMQLSYPIKTVRISAKILLLASGTSMYLLFMMYSANLTSEMTIGPGSHHVRNFDDVIKGDYKVIVKEATSQSEELKNALPGTAKREYYHDQIKGNPKAYVKGLDEAMEIMKDNDKTLFFYTPTARFITDELKFINTQGNRTLDQLALLVINISNLNCVNPSLEWGQGISPFISRAFIMILRFCFQLHQDGIKAHLGMVFQKDSQLVECFNHHLHRMIQSGVMSQINGRARSINKKFNSIDDVVVLSYENVIFPSLVLLTGIALSISQLAIEKVWARIQRVRIPA